MKKLLGVTAELLVYGIMLLAVGPTAFAIGVLASMTANTSTYSGAADGWRFLALVGALAAVAGLCCLCYGVWKAGRKLDDLHRHIFGATAERQNDRAPRKAGPNLAESDQDRGPESPGS